MIEELRQVDRALQDLIQIIHFTGRVSAKIHGMLDEAEILRTVKEEFARSRRYSSSIVLLTDDGSKLKITATSLPLGKLKTGEKVSGVRLKGYNIDLKKSSIYRRVVKEGKTVQVKIDDVIAELFPRPLAYLISKTMGYEKKRSILTPLKLRGKIIGALAVTSTDLAEYFIPSLKNLARHISAALELAYECAERKKAEKALKKARDELKKRVEERTAELSKSNLLLKQEITERKRVGGALRRSQKRLKRYSESLEETVKERTEKLSQLVEYQREFIADIGHELRTPLSVIKAVVETELMNGETSPLAEQLTLVNKKVDQITQIIRELMLVSRLDIGQEGMRKTKFKLRYLMEEVLEDVTKEAERERIAPKITLSCPETIELHNDRTKISGVLTNLLRNAVVHSRGRPRIFLKVKNRGEYIQIAVEDDNQPIPKEELKKIFEKFYRSKQARENAGSGLGLYISEKLVKLAGGRIWAESERGVGNKFVVQLPVSK